MTTKHFLIGLSCLAISACSSTPTPQTALDDARKAMGSTSTLQYSGKGVSGNYGQALTAGEAWPKRDLTSYSRSINYDQRSSSEVIEFAQPVFGGQRQNPVVNGDKAWNVADAGPAPQLPAAEGRQLRIWMTPHGFLTAAAQATDTAMRPVEGGREISFTTLGKYKMTGVVDNQNMVTRIETTVGDPVLGDTPLAVSFSDYRDFGGVKFPAHIVEEQGGSMTLDVTVDNVQPGAPVSLPVPDAVQSATVPRVTTQSTQLAPGVWHVMGGSHHSLVVEFADFITVVEGPLSDERGVAVIAEAKKLVPNKPIRYVVSTHHHFDHASGLRAFVAEGTTVVTHESNKAYFEKAFTTPATVVPDTLAKNPKAPVLQTVSDKHVITDGKQTIEVHQIPGDTHSTELLVAYLPGPRILVEGDAYSPNDPNAAPQPPPANAVNLYDKVMGLKLNVATIAAIHGRGAVPFAELRKFVSK